MKKIAIIGFGCAAYHALKGIRSIDSESPIDIYSATAEAPYNPMLTTYYASGRIPEAQLFPLGSLDEIQENFKANVFTSRLVRELRLPELEVVSTGGAAERYSDIIIASGARAVIPPIGDLPDHGIYTMRTADDARSLHELLETGLERVLVVGAQMVGIKVVELLRRRGIKVLLADMAGHMFPASAYEDIAGEIAARLERAGVQLKFGSAVSAVKESGKQLEAQFSDGDSYVCDAVVFCSGIKPNIDFLDRSRIDVGYAVKADPCMQTSVPHVYAAGDCCETANMIGSGNAYIGLWANSARQGSIAGINLAGGHERYEGNLIHNITHYMDTDFISVGSVRSPGEIMSFGKEGKWRIEATLDDGRLVALNILDNASLSGPVKNVLIHQASHPGEKMGPAAKLALARSGLPTDFIKKIGG